MAQVLTPLPVPLASAQAQQPLTPAHTLVVWPTLPTLVLILTVTAAVTTALQAMVQVVIILLELASALGRLQLTLAHIPAAWPTLLILAWIQIVMVAATTVLPTMVQVAIIPLVLVSVPDLLPPTLAHIPVE